MNFIPDWISDLAAIITIIGFGITIYQVKKIRNTTDRINIEVKATQDKMQKAFAISDISRICEIINIVNIDISKRSLEMAHHRMQEINNLIIEIKEVRVLQSFDDIKKLDGRRRFLTNDLAKLQQAVYVCGDVVPDELLSSIMENLRAISEHLLKLNAKLKNGQNG